MTVGRSRIGGPAAAIGAAAAAMAVAQAGPGLLALPRVRAALPDPVADVGDPGGVALTFDDGPNPASTPQFVRQLADRGVRATFFLVGSMVLRAPDVAQSIVEAGHEVALHGWSHRPLLLRAPRATYRDLARARTLIAQVTGQMPRFFRPPHGLFSTWALLAARRLGLTPVLWTCWGHDWTPQTTPQSILARVRPGLIGGATVLLHDSDGVQAPCAWQATLGALPDLLDECARRGLRVGPLREHLPAA